MEIVGVLISGLLGGAMFFLIGKAFMKFQGKIQKNIISKRIDNSRSSGNVNKSDLFDMIKYFVNVDDKLQECDKYIKIADEFYPNDKEFNFIITTYYLAKKNFNKAILRANNAIGLNPEDAEYLYLKGLVYFKEGNMELAKEYQDKAISVDAKLASKKYV